MNKKNKLSAVINTKNVEKILPEAIKSLNFADEIIVVDMCSSDKTVAVAKKLGAKVFSHPDVGYADPARDFALSKANNDWILVLDADETISKTLANKITEITNSKTTTNAFLIPRKNIIFGKWMKHTGWWPDYQIRLFRKNTVSWKVGVHRHPDIIGKSEKLPANEDLSIIHMNYESIEQFINKLNKYTTIQAKERSNKKNIKDIDSKKVFDTFWQEFISRFYSKKGYKDNLHGISLSFLQSFYELVILLKQWQNQDFTFDKEKNNHKENDAINFLDSWIKDFHYWRADYFISNSSGLRKLYWKLRRKFRL